MTTCEGCEYEEQHCIPRNCIDKSGERKNWTAPAPAPKVTDAPSCDSIVNAWLAVYRLCEELGYKPVDTGCGRDNIIAFIRALAQRAGEGYTVEDVRSWLMARRNNQTCNSWCECIDRVISRLNDTQDGIKAVTKRKGG